VAFEQHFALLKKKARLTKRALGWIIPDPYTTLNVMVSLPLYSHNSDKGKLIPLYNQTLQTVGQSQMIHIHMHEYLHST
jgi:hypothetical protein